MTTLRFTAAIFVAASLLLAGCDRGPRSRSRDDNTAKATPAHAVNLPEYRFEFDVDAADPAVVGFIRQFLETALAGDYPGYRRLVSRYETPESEQRFEAIFGALRLLEVVSIELMDFTRHDGAPVYRVISRVEFDPASNVSLRHRDRAIAILVFKEDGEWRMMPAPPDLQPERDARAATTAPAEPSTQPSYPWDETGDD